uniref:MRG domain-containing protein n=1 Tax=Panagrolaimus davidi TaxID=227884 RepID=A0A914Q9H8_9BILA
MAEFVAKQNIFCRSKKDLKWYRSKIENANGKIFMVHYYNWNPKFDEFFTVDESKEHFREFTAENARLIQNEAVELLDLPFFVYTMKNLGFPNEQPNERFSKFLEKHPEALRAKSLKTSPPLCAIPSATPKVPVNLPSSYFAKKFTSSASNAINIRGPLKPMLASNNNVDIPMNSLQLNEPNEPQFTVQEIIEDAVNQAAPFFEFVENDLEKCKQNYFPRLPARVTVIDILNHYISKFYEDPIENREILAENALQMFNHFALTKLVMPHEKKYVLGVLNIAQEGVCRPKFLSLDSGIQLDLNIFGYNYLCRLVKFAFVYYNNTPEEENDEEFRKLIRSWIIFAKFLKKCRKQFFNDKIDYIKILSDVPNELEEQENDTTMD